jgi:hypothetical protein
MHKLKFQKTQHLTEKTFSMEKIYYTTFARLVSVMRLSSHANVKIGATAEGVLLYNLNSTTRTLVSRLFAIYLNRSFQTTSTDRKMQ